MKTIRERTEKRPWLNWVIFIATIVVVFIIGLFASSIIERRSESKLYFQMTTEIPDWEPRNEVWGQNFPRQYQTYMKTADTNFASAHGGS
ncbi:MAG: ammonia-forming cytochrome c nitrite reductase subunit c552, partial [Actinomycetota bacterium]|nr:ammonia-forming cytochrome c nitrite reductase subunit c552 [Actinomycetota bacterium]